MEIQTKQQILQYINRSVENVDEQAEAEKAKEKINSILSAESADTKAVEAVKAFIASGDVNSQKLYAFCLDFVDPTFSPQTVMQGSEEVQFHAYLEQDDLTKLCRFIERHKRDGSFGEMVYKVMEAHEMISTDVYKSVYMRRQDFSRVTAPDCESISRRMAWQVIIGLQCNMDEADALLFSAGYVRRNSPLDLTMQYFIQHKNYDIVAIDAVLEDLGQKTYTY